MEGNYKFLHAFSIGIEINFVEYKLRILSSAEFLVVFAIFISHFDEILGEASS